jgi:hypothetical protein
MTPYTDYMELHQMKALSVEEATAIFPEAAMRALLMSGEIRYFTLEDDNVLFCTVECSVDKLDDEGFELTTCKRLEWCSDSSAWKETPRTGRYDAVREAGYLT